MISSGRLAYLIILMVGVLSASLKNLFIELNQIQKS